jgi:hypothetical protein
MEPQIRRRPRVDGILPAMLLAAALASGLTLGAGVGPAEARLVRDINAAPDQ